MIKIPPKAVQQIPKKLMTARQIPRCFRYFNRQAKITIKDDYYNSGENSRRKRN
jgi:hypothetical protein